MRLQRFAGVARAQRLCTAYGLGDMAGTYHTLFRCSAHNAERANIYATVMACAPPAMVLWLGDIGLPANDAKWAAIVLDGELDGLPLACAYGRHSRAIRAFPDFDANRLEYLEIIRWRRALRVQLAHPLVAMVRRASSRFGYTGV